MRSISKSITHTISSSSIVILSQFATTNEDSMPYISNNYVTSLRIRSSHVSLLHIREVSTISSVISYWAIHSHYHAKISPKDCHYGVSVVRSWLSEAMIYILQYYWRHGSLKKIRTILWKKWTKGLSLNPHLLNSYSVRSMLLIQMRCSYSNADSRVVGGRSPSCSIFCRCRNEISIM